MLDTTVPHLVSKQFGEGFDGNRPHQRDLGEDSVKCAGLQRIMQAER